MFLTRKGERREGREHEKLEPNMEGKEEGEREEERKIYSQTDAKGVGLHPLKDKKGLME